MTATTPPTPDFDPGFQPTNPETWQKVVEKSLKGRPLASLDWQTDEGFAVPCVVQAAKRSPLVHADPRLQGLQTRTGPWQIRERIAAGSITAARTQIHAALAGGADELLINLDFLGQAGLDPSASEEGLAGNLAGSLGVPIYHLADLEALLADFDLTDTLVAFAARNASLPLLASLQQLTGQLQLGSIELGMDPVHQLFLVPPRGSNAKQLTDAMPFALQAINDLQDLRPFAIHGHGFHRAGADVASELACVLSVGACYLKTMADHGAQLAHALNSLCLRLPVGTELYLEIAKLRAVRLLWARLAADHGANQPEQLRILVHGETSERARATATDLHNNLVRGTVQTFAAITGGCDSITVLPFDTRRSDTDEAGQSLARNQQILLREESYLDRVQDPTAGADAIELLTDQVARHAWDLHGQIEEHGGILQALENGFLSEHFNQTSERRADSFRTRRRTMVGVNRYVKVDEAAFADRSDEATKQAQQHDELAQTFAAFLRKRNQPAAEQHLGKLDGCDDLAVIGRCVAAGATFAEVLAAQRGDGRVLIAEECHEYPATDGSEFESLQSQPVRLPITILQVGEPRLARARASFARDLLHTGSFHVLDAGHHTDLDAILQSLADNDRVLSVSVEGDLQFRFDSRMIVLCGDDETVDNLLPQLHERIAEPSGGRDLTLIVAAKPRPTDGSIIDSFLFKDMDVPEYLDELFRRMFSTPFSRWQAGLAK